MTVFRFALWITTVLLVQFAEAAETPLRNPQCNEFEDPTVPTHLPYPGDCTKFYKCSKGYAHPLSCQTLHWSIAANRCEYPAVAGCDKSIVPGVQKHNINVAVPVTSCPPKDITALTQLPFPGDCTKFYKCLTGKAYPFSCPPGLHWNVSTDRCDLPDVARCGSGVFQSQPIPPPPPPPPTRPQTTTPKNLSSNPFLSKYVHN